MLDVRKDPSTIVEEDEDDMAFSMASDNNESPEITKSSLIEEDDLSVSINNHFSEVKPFLEPVH
jgi:hypothetical protein